MKYIFRGKLCGYLCDDCYDWLSGIEVLLYLPWQKEKVLANAVADTKETFHLVSKEENASRKELLIARTKTDEEGNFEFELDEKYANTAFDIDFVCGTVPRNPGKPRKDPLQFHLTTVYPQWRLDQRERYFFHWKYCIPAKWWCFIRGHYFDAWVICGRIVVCGTKTPIPNVKITAWDADFFSDDNLGSATSDANGHFRIDYSTLTFKQTFLSPWINIETDPGPHITFKSGPDVYFKYELNGVPIQGETSANRRNNVGYCLCVELCLKDIVVPEPVIPASFTKIGNNGNHFINELVASGNPNVIALATGKTPASQAFFSCIKLRGNLTKTLGGQPMEYSFDTIETNGPGGSEIGTWQKVTTAKMCEAEIGTFFTLTGDPMNPVSIVPYNVGNTSGGVDGAGWIAVPQASNFSPNINGELLSLNTATLNGATVNMAGLIQGQSTTTRAALQQNRFFKIRMVKRQVGNALTEVVAGVSNPVAMFNTVYNNVPQFGSWMPQTSNEMGVACIDIQEMIGGGGGTGCTPITTALHVNYTAANPNMGAVSLTLYGPGGPYSIQNVTPASSVAETFGTATELHNPALVPVSSLNKCAYTVILSVELKLTNGENQHSNIEDWLSFCKS
ncbi:MAG TPA: hypothetical protein VHM26_18455 [Chitinophagaceae bacterium]|jgi:hypothetical protein|nr:hypothetical protein [Chitinophagaceae bacterium]